jgi:hypothetical protein
VPIDRHQFGPQLPDPFYKCADQFRLGAFTGLFDYQ